MDSAKASLAERAGNALLWRGFGVVAGKLIFLVQSQVVLTVSCYSALAHYSTTLVRPRHVLSMPIIVFDSLGMIKLVPK